MKSEEAEYMDVYEVVAKGIQEREEKWGELKAEDQFVIVLDDDVVHVKVGDLVDDKQRISITAFHPIRINAKLQISGFGK